MVDKYELRDKVLAQFYSLAEEEQFPWVLRITGASEIFPMVYFNQFCSQHFPGDYLEVAELVKSSWITNPFNKTYLWCKWDEKRRLFWGANKIKDFVPNQAETAIYFLETPNALEEIGFTKYRANKLREAYKKIGTFFTF